VELILRNGTLLTPTGPVRSDLGVEGTRIAKIAERIAEPGAEEIDASGLIVFPGAIDGHTHMETPVRGTLSSDTFETGTKAALHGGVTTIVDFTVQSPGESLLESAEKRRATADPEVRCDFALHVNVTDFSVDLEREMVELVKLGYPTFKIFTAYRREGLWAGPDSLHRILEISRNAKALVLVHAEDAQMMEEHEDMLVHRGHLGPENHPRSRPDFVEADAIRSVCVAASRTGAPVYVVHVSTRWGLETIRRARASGIRVYAETCPQYLLLTDDVYAQEGGFRFIVNPPLRRRDDVEALWGGIEDGTIDTVATDHCPFVREHEFPGDFRTVPTGLPGVETLVSLLYSEGFVKRGLSPERLVELVCTNPARIFGLPDRGTLETGSRADLMLLDPKAERTLHASDLHMNTNFSPYEGRKVRGIPVCTVLAGRPVMRDGEMVSPPPRGEFVPSRL
jgi:dihydropyrimidinase